MPATKTKSAKRPKARKQTRCWPGYEPVAGKKPYSSGSCKKK
jgi:hypothetical protein